MENLDLENVSKYLINKISEFQDYEYYLDLNEEERNELPYVLFGIFHDFYVDNFGDKILRKKINNFLEELSSSDSKDIQELVSFGFLENIKKKSNIFEDMVNGFGQNTRRLLKETVTHHENLGQFQNKKLDVND